MIKKDDALLQAFDEARDYFVAFGDRYRQEIIVILAQHPQLTVKELAEKLHLSRPATSHHIKILRDAGMLAEHTRITKYFNMMRRCWASDGMELSGITTRRFSTLF